MNRKFRGQTLKKRFAAVIAKTKTKTKIKTKTETNTKKPIGVRRGAIEARIEELREKEEWAFRKRHGKTDFYEYLKEVYRRREWAKQHAKEVAVLYEIDVRKNTTPIRIIIEASSAEKDRQKKSRWVRALQYAEAKKERKSKFVDFLVRNGGPAGCATKMAALEKDRAKGKKPAGKGIH